MSDHLSEPGSRVEAGRNRGAGRVIRGLAAAALMAASALGVYRLASADAPAADRTPEVPPAPAKGQGPPPAGVSPQAAADPFNRPTSAELVGERTCRECHPGESALYARSGHARTLRRGDLSAIARWLDGKTVKDPEDPAVTWTYALASGRLEVERAANGKFECFPLDWAVGSGGNGVTFVTRRPPDEPGAGARGVEHRLSYFHASKKMDVTPGQGKGDSSSKRAEVKPHGRELGAMELGKCLNCHATNISATLFGQVDPATLVPNVSCERCHGPGRAHVEAARRGAPESELTMPLGSSDTKPTRQIDVCGICHRSLRNVSAAQVDERNPEIARFQPVGLEMSWCFQRGRSGLTCTSCHDPHAKVSRDHAAYESVCLKCHSVTHRRTCPVNAKDGCIDCHMPKRTVSVEFQFTDHWIRRPKKDETAAGTR